MAFDKRRLRPVEGGTWLLITNERGHDFVQRDDGAWWDGQWVTARVPARCKPADDALKRDEVPDRPPKRPAQPKQPVGPKLTIPTKERAR